MRLAEKTVLITGSGSGQGREAAILFAKEGAQVVVTDISQDAINGTLKQIADGGGQAVGKTMDVSDSTQVQEAIKVAVDRFGKLDILYNNAGVWLRTEDGPIAKLEDRIWDLTINTNLRGMYHCCKYAIPQMIKSGGGSIVNTASVAGLMGTYSSAYSASKGGMISLSRTIATTYAKQNIRSNVICPGYVDTPMSKGIADNPKVLQAYIEATPLQRGGKPIDTAYMALYLASDEASFVTGGVFVVDGGVYAR